MEKTTSARPSQPQKRLRRECPHCRATRFHRESIGHYDEVSGEFIIDEITLRCLTNHHVFNERDLVIVEVQAL